MLPSAAALIAAGILRSCGQLPLADVALSACLGFFDKLLERWEILQLLAHWGDLLGNANCDFADFFRVENQHTLLLCR